MIEVSNEPEGNRLFFYLFIISVIVAYSPLKAVALVYPWAFTLLYVFSSRKNAVNNFRRILIFVIVFFCMGLFYHFLNRDFIFFNYFLFMITASSFLVLFLDFSYVARKETLIKFVRFLTYFCFFQACVALVQVFYTAFFVKGSFDLSAGDAAQGTIALQLTGDDSASNPMFAILQSSLLVFIGLLSKGLTGRIPIFILVLIFLSWLFAAVLHTVFFWMFALVLTLLLFPGYRSLADRQPEFRFLKQKAFAVAIAILLGSGIVLVILQPMNLAYLRDLSGKAFTLDPNRATFKTLATFSTITNLPHDKPFQPFVGLGPGQYSSRAGLIASGEYLSRPILTTPFVGPELDKYILVHWRVFKRDPSGGSSRFPFYSWLSLFGELGMTGVLLVLAFVGIVIIKLKGLATQIPPLIPMGVIFIIVYIMALGLQDNYWEFTQPLFIIILLSKLCYEYSKHEAKSISEKYSDS